MNHNIKNYKKRNHQRICNSVEIDHCNSMSKQIGYHNAKKFKNYSNNYIYVAGGIGGLFAIYLLTKKK